ncbi:D-Ala-D-Ala carboxypeptidase family metallohydrolase [Peptococcaceae bacterium 1198_IL3148]
MLALGSGGAEVLQLQQDLATCGFDPGPRDGIFGPLTNGAVKALQNHCGLPTNGYNAATQRALKLLLPHQARQGQPLSEHFSELEFACRCCGQVRVNVKLITLLEQLRTRLGARPIMVTSGYRCPKHNRAVGGVKNSQHLRGNAADIVILGVPPSQVAATATAIGFTWVGLYPTFTHLDVR